MKANRSAAALFPSAILPSTCPTSRCQLAAAAADRRDTSRRPPNGWACRRSGSCNGAAWARAAPGNRPRAPPERPPAPAPHARSRLRAASPLGVQRRERRIQRRGGVVFRSGGRAGLPEGRQPDPPPPLSRSGSSEGRTTGFIGRIESLGDGWPPQRGRLAPYVFALCIAFAADAGTTIQPRLPSRSTASVSRITTPAASADLRQAASTLPGFRLAGLSGPNAIPVPAGMKHAPPPGEG